jgi:hypothetical protein
MRPSACLKFARAHQKSRRFSVTAAFAFAVASLDSGFSPRHLDLVAIFWKLAHVVLLGRRRTSQFNGRFHDCNVLPANPSTCSSGGLRNDRCVAFVREFDSRCTK